MFKRLAWMLLAGGWVFMAASLLSFSPADWPSHVAAPVNAQPDNWCGWVGAAAGYQGYAMLGPGIWVMMAGLAAYLLATLCGRTVDQVGVRAVGIVTMGLVTSAFLNFLLPNAGPMPEGNGGLLAIVSVDALYTRFNYLGTLLMLGMCFGVGSLLAIDELVLALPKGLAALLRKIASIPMPTPVLVGAWKRVSLPRVPRFGFGRPAEKGATRGRRIPVDPSAKRPPARLGDKTSAKQAAELDIVDPDTDPELQEFESRIGELAVSPQGEAITEEMDDEIEEEIAEFNEDDDAVDESVAEDEPDDEEEESEVEAKSKSLDPDTLREKMKNLPIRFASQNKPTGAPAVPAQDLSGYRFPDIALLCEPDDNFSEAVELEVREQGMILERALQTYRIDGTVVNAEAGPVITLYDVKLAPGTKVAAINSLASDLARELKAQNIRVVANTVGKNTVAIEVPNLKKERVRIKELMALAGADLLDKSRLPMFLGKDASGEAPIADLTKMPHMLIAGTTGSGKSVCMNSIIMSFLYTRRPDELKLVLVDPKMVEMSQFKDIPHLMCPVVTEMNKAAAILEWAVTKMGERYELLAEAGVRDIDGYNNIPFEELKDIFKPANEEEEKMIPKKLPRLVFVIDELADLMMTNKEVEGFIVRIAQKARAVGIHLILATQRPEAKVVTGLIKGNMPCRIAFKVASGLDSRIVLDQKGAELLLGQGDMLFMAPSSGSELIRAQGTLVDDHEVRATVRFLKNVAQPSFEPQLMQLKAPGQGAAEEAERDDLFDDAVMVVLESQRGSVSLLQRKLGIGYGRASRMIELMGEFGILGTHKGGGQAREVTLTVEEWEAMKAMQQADVAVEVNGAIAEEAESFEAVVDVDEVVDKDEDYAEEDTDTDELTDEEMELAAMADEDAEEYEEYEYEEDEDENNA